MASGAATMGMGAFRGSMRGGDRGKSRVDVRDLFDERRESFDSVLEDIERLNETLELQDLGSLDILKNSPAAEPEKEDQEEEPPEGAFVSRRARRTSRADAHRPVLRLPKQNLTGYKLLLFLLSAGKLYSSSKCSAETFIVLDNWFKRMMKSFMDYTCATAAFGCVMMAIDNEVLWSFNNQPNDASTAIKMLISISTLVSLVCLTFFYLLKKEYYKLLGNIPSEAHLLNCKLRKWYLLEFFIILIHTPPFVDGSFKIEALGRVQTYTFDMVGGLLIFLRLYLLPRFILFRSKYYHRQHLFVKVISNIRVNAVFVIKTILYFHPFTALICAWIFVVLTSGYFIRLCERPVNPDHDWYWNSLWLTVITMTTVGYGDMNPETHCGRTFAVIAAVLGVCITSLSIVVVSNRISLSGDEVRVVSMIEKDTERRRFRNLACLCVQYAWKFYVAKMRLDADKMAIKRTLYHLVQQFRQSKRSLHSAIAEFNASMNGAMLEDMFQRGQQIDDRLEQLATVTLKLQKNNVRQLAFITNHIRKSDLHDTPSALSSRHSASSVTSSSSSSAAPAFDDKQHPNNNDAQSLDDASLASTVLKMRKNMQRMETKVDRMMALIENLHVAAVSDDEAAAQVPS